MTITVKLVCFIGAPPRVSAEKTVNERFFKRCPTKQGGIGAECIEAKDYDYATWT